MSAVEERICDRRLLKLLRAMLRAGVMEDGAVRRSGSGTPQGGVVSPVLCQRLPAPARPAMAERGHGVLVRYADDLLRMCKTKREAEDALAALSAILAEMGLELKPAKTRIVHLREGGEGFDFLGFHHRWVRGHTPGHSHLTFLVRWPSRQAMQHARQRVREITARERLRWPSKKSSGTSTGSCAAGRATSATETRPSFDKITLHAQAAGDIRAKASEPRRYGRWAFDRQSPDRCGLVTLNGTIAPPRPNRPWHQGAECRR